MFAHEADKYKLLSGLLWCTGISVLGPPFFAHRSEKAMGRATGLMAVKGYARRGQTSIRDTPSAVGSKVHPRWVVLTATSRVDYTSAFHYILLYFLELLYDIGVRLVGFSWSRVPSFPRRNIEYPFVLLSQFEL